MTAEVAFSVKLSPRDAGLIRDLFESRVMTLAQIAALHFEGKGEAAKKRVQKLKRAGFIAARMRHVSDPAVHFLTPKGLEALLEQDSLAGYPKLSRPQMLKRSQVSELTLRHELQVMDVKAGFATAVQAQPNLKVLRFSTWPMLHEFRAAGPTGEIVTVKPDGFILLREQQANAAANVYTFFLEVDRGSETQDTLAARASCYADYYLRGGFAVKNGVAADQFKTMPFRVLFVLQTPERRNNTAERMLLLPKPIFSHSWLTTFAEITSNPLGDIWMTPRNYHEVTRGTEFDPQRRRNVVGYSRSAEREELVDRQIRKLSILE